MRIALRIGMVCAAGLLCFVAAGCAHSGSIAGSQISAAKAAEAGGGPKGLELLKEGNQRFVSGKAINPSTDAETLRVAAEKGQHPFVAVLSCSDSRVPVERVFDRGAGEIFVVRVAGNVTSKNETGSIEYSMEALKVPLLVVMGHTQCGAVKAACAGASLTPNIDSFLANIQPAVQRVKASQPGLEKNKEAFEVAVIEENVRQTLRDLYATSPLIREQVSTGKVEVALAMVDISNGQVSWLNEVPRP